MLREELEYFSIPTKDSQSATDEAGIANDAMIDMKRQCGEWLMDKRNIFTALQRNVNKENNMAEQHLIDMLCMRFVRRVFFRLCPNGVVPVASIGRMNGASAHSSPRDAAYHQLLLSCSRRELPITPTVTQSRSITRK